MERDSARSKDRHTDDVESQLKHQPETDFQQTLPFGKLQKLIDDPSIEEIWVNSPTRIFFARNGHSYLAPFVMTFMEIRDATERMLAWSGRRVDLSQPFVDARLPNGARLHVVIPDITSEFWTLNIRKKSLYAFTLDDLVVAGAFSKEVLEIISVLIVNRANILVSGATQAGKTTLLNCLLGELPSNARLITLEEVFELNPRVADHVALQTRTANLEGSGEVSLRMLVRESLRMRPTTLVIGEVRGPEALDLLLAFNSGIPGMASIHANSSLDALRKVSALPLLASPNITREFVCELSRENIDAVIHCSIDDSGTRRISEVALVNKRSTGPTLEVESIVQWKNNCYTFKVIDFDNIGQIANLPSLLVRLNAEQDFVDD